ncbi:radical SAM protein [Candidatus Woesearchaeota archaeon]|nr:radical SAM protein [Candidatus Woesearchaeota archaeon]
MKYSDKKFNALLSCVAAKFGKKTPLKVTHYITDRCNLLCEYCYAKKFQKGPAELTTQQVKDSMKEFASFGCTTWVLIGGEPLVRSDIGELIDYGQSLGMIVNLVTNASFVPQKLDQVCRADNLYTSLDGEKEIHDAIRGKGSYDAVMKAIDLVQGARHLC